MAQNLSAHTLCCFVSEQIIHSAIGPWKAITSAFIQKWKFWGMWQKFTLLLIELWHFLDSKMHFFTLSNLLIGGVLHLVSKNWRLKVNMGINEEDSASCISLKASKYKPDVNYLSLLCSSKRCTKSKICLLVFPFFNVAYNNCNWHNNNSIILYKSSLINTAVFKLF